MLRTDRLFEVIDLLRRTRGPLTAHAIAQAIEVCDRTVYRYIARLQSLRVPIDGAAGVGYILRPGYDLPPLNFDAAEQEALIVGMALLARTGDADLQKAARRVLTKVETSATVPGALGVSDWGIAAGSPDTGRILRRAIRDEAELRITYLSLDGVRSTRDVKPLTLTYWVEVAVLSGWCALRKDFRAFRTDRIEALAPTGVLFTDEGAHLRQIMHNTQESP